ncbi:HicA-like toxin [Gordonia phage Commandaria]|uniref:HicA-like toxin n=1 Tax=Gordonia phage Commandaria TaxID=3038364 RepID=A0AAF0GG79_9CAUD|nr:HicA-like toxin [Gordonia phage Commandaria]WGH20791.1 HicA-like toxin [Gordonia phage Commandaria]
MIPRTQPGSKNASRHLNGGNKYYNELARKIDRAGGEIRWPTGKGHPRVFFRGQFITTLAITSSDIRSNRNVLSRCRRAGMKV